MAVLDMQIRERAYAIWEREGRPDGREAQHWEQAAREVLASGTGETAGKPTRASKGPTLKSGLRSRSRKAA